MKNEYGPPGPRDLRKRAEATMATAGDDAAGEPELSPEDARELVHELRTHQIELGMQNEELRRAQLELAAARDRFSDLYDYAPVGYVTVSAKGTIVEANLTLAKMLGHPRSRLIGQLLSAFILPADEDVYYLHRRKLLAAGERRAGERGDCELRLLRNDEVGAHGCAPDASLWVKVESVSVAADEAHGVRMRCAISDVSAHKEAEEQRRRLEEQLVQSHKLEGLGGLARGIAHDFNNLLMAIQCNLELALEELPSTSPAREYLAVVGTATQHAADLVTQILAYAGNSTVKVAALDLSSLIAEMRRLLELDVENSVEVRYHLGSDLPAVNADATQIRQVLLNLITNAVAAIGEDSGSITVTTRAANCGREFFRQAYVDDDLAVGRYVCFDVADTGRGMDEATRARIFEPFFTTRAEGLGLGLASTMGIVRAHLGAVRLISEVGRGTTFTIALPAVAPAARPAGAAALRSPDQPAPAARKAGGTVLLVEDEEVIRGTVAKVLRKLGCEVLTAADGAAGVEVFRRHADEIALVLLDLKMPKMGGEAALPEIRRIRADAKVVLCSGYSEKIAAEMLGGESPWRFLQKPVRLARLRQLIGEVMSLEE